MKEEPKEFRELREKWSELGWKDCYKIFDRELIRLFQTFAVYVDIPEFAEDEEALINMICETDKNFEDFLKSFYKELYELVILLREGEEVSFFRLFEVGNYWGRIKEKFMNLKIKEGRRDLEKIIDSIKEKMATTLVHISILSKRVKQKSRSRRRIEE